MALEESSTPRLSVNNEDMPKCTLKFQCGLLRETETFLGDDVRYLCTEAVLEYVSDMLYFKVYTHNVNKCMVVIIMSLYSTLCQTMINVHLIGYWIHHRIL